MGFQGQDASGALCCALHGVRMCSSPGKQGWGSRETKLLGPPGSRPGGRGRHRRWHLVCFVGRRGRRGAQRGVAGGASVAESEENVSTSL